MAVPCPRCGREYDVTLFQFGRTVECDCGTRVTRDARVRGPGPAGVVRELAIGDAETAELLRWALPRLGLRWRGFRRVRRQVRKRIARRVAELGLDGVAAYRARLQEDPREWPLLDAACRITISRFWRDRGTWERLRDEVLPELARAAAAQRRLRLRAWSVGCASGEEPYSLRILWDLALAPAHPALELEIVASDVDRELLERAGVACYPQGASRELPAALRSRAFESRGETLRLLPALRHGIEWVHQDVRRSMPEGPFDLVLCRNLVFTYYDESLQRDVLRGLVARIGPGGLLVVGRHETLPADGGAELEPWPGDRTFFRRRG